MHKDQLALDVGTVRRLVDEQFPQWRALPIRQVSTAGTVNAIFRLGEDLAARFPLRRQEERRVRDWLRAEAAAMQEFADLSWVRTAEYGIGVRLASITEGRRRVRRLSWRSSPRWNMPSNA
jgi:aminoglycoside phosphotransferase (APT) family kinase protein